MNFDTGMALLRSRLKEMGLTDSQCSSKSVAATLAVLADSPQILDIHDAERRLEEIRREIRLEENHMQDIVNQERKIYEEIDELCRKANENIRHYFDDMEACETPQGRDQIRKIHLFTQMCSIQTPQNNPYFIAGLAAILADEKSFVTNPPVRIEKEIRPVIRA